MSNLVWCLKRFLCFFGVHWSIVTDRFSMGDGKSCDICGLQKYGSMFGIHSRRLGTGQPPNPRYEVQRHATTKSTSILMLACDEEYATYTGDDDGFQTGHDEE